MTFQSCHPLDAAILTAMLLDCPHKLTPYVRLCLHIFVSISICILSSLLSLRFGRNGWSWSLSGNCNSLNMINKEVFKKEKACINFSEVQKTSPTSLSGIFSSAVIFSLTCFRLCRSWREVTSVLLLNTTTALENSGSSAPRTVAMWWWGSRFRLYT